MKRRTIDFESADEVIGDINDLRTSGYVQTGNWNLTQICQHLAATMDSGMDGFGFRAPWILRATVFHWGFRYALKKRKLGRGVPTFKMLRPNQTESKDDDKIIDICIESCLRAASYDKTLTQYPLLNDLSADDWRAFMWIHAAHHLSFLVPNANKDTDL